MIVHRGEQTLEPCIPHDVSHGEKNKDNNVDDKDHVAQPSEPSGVIRQVMDEDRGDAGAHVDREEARREVEACSV